LSQPDAWTLKTKELVDMSADFQGFIGALASLSDSENTRPQVPLLVLQADNDEVVLAQLTNKMVSRFKTLGLDVESRSYHIGDKGIYSNHQVTVPASQKDALEWAEKRLPSGR
jgi:predicted esterase